MNSSKYKPAIGEIHYYSGDVIPDGWVDISEQFLGKFDDNWVNTDGSPTIHIKSIMFTNGAPAETVMDYLNIKNDKFDFEF